MPNGETKCHMRHPLIGKLAKQGHPALHGAGGFLGQPERHPAYLEMTMKWDLFSVDNNQQFELIWKNLGVGNLLGMAFCKMDFSLPQRAKARVLNALSS